MAAVAIAMLLGGLVIFLASLPQTSATFIPLSASLRIATIWLSVNRLFFIVSVRIQPEISRFVRAAFQGKLTILRSEKLLSDIRMGQRTGFVGGSADSGDSDFPMES
jgi:hypothetical protein